VIDAPHRPTAAAEAYDRTAPYYDLFTEHHDYELWVGNLLGWAAAHGLRHGRVLDVGCGTGKSLQPLLARGWHAHGCDASSGMLARARARLGLRAELSVADVIELGPRGEFELVMALDDVLNCLCEPGQLAMAMRGLAANLAPDGLLVFDVNTLATYRDFFASTCAVESPEALLLWRGQGSGEPRPGEVVEARLDAFRPGSAGHWRRESVVHRQRHHPRAAVEAALAEAGLALVALAGHDLSARLQSPLDESRHTKAIYLARPARPEPGRR
jgi:SAM-dependent methyltransferase